MKIRSDFISNSSSSSFIVVLDKNYKFEKFIKDVSRSCIQNGQDWSKSELTELKNKNIRNLDYCLNTFELIYLGYLEIEYKKHEYVKPISDSDTDAKYEWEYAQDIVTNIRNGFIPDDENNPDLVKIIKANKNKIVLKERECIVSPVIPREDMWHYRDHFSDTPENFDGKCYISSICEDAINKYKQNIFDSPLSDLYEITLDTVLNTKDLISAGKKIYLDKWMNLEDLEKRLRDGNRIFYIRMNQGGDGFSHTAIYALGGWDADFNRYANCEILASLGD